MAAIDPQTYIGERQTWTASSVWNITDLGSSLPNSGGVTRTEFVLLAAGTGSGGTIVLSDEDIRAAMASLWPNLVIGLGSNQSLVDKAGGSAVNGGQVFIAQHTILCAQGDDALTGSRGAITMTGIPGQVLAFKLVFYHRNPLTGDALVLAPQAFVGKSATITMPAAGITIGSGSFTISSGNYYVQHFVDPNIQGGTLGQTMVLRTLGSANNTDVLPSRTRLGLALVGLTTALGDAVNGPTGSDPFTNPADIAVGGHRLDDPQALTPFAIAQKAIRKLNVNPLKPGVCPGQDGVASLGILPILVPDGTSGQRWAGKVSVANPTGLVSGSRVYLELSAVQVKL